jgi:hypothetical protein
MRSYPLQVKQPGEIVGLRRRGCEISDGKRQDVAVSFLRSLSYALASIQLDLKTESFYLQSGIGINTHYTPLPICNLSCYGEKYQLT